MKAPIQRIADTISSIFVPTVLVIVSLTFIAWAVLTNVFHIGVQTASMGNASNPCIIAIVAAVAVLVAACPCALGLGTDVAMEASDITLVKGNLKSIATALSLSRATLHIIKQNLFWASAYNVVLISMAILSPVIPFLRENAPIFAAAAMALSSVTVVSNSLRLRRFDR